MSRSPNEKPKMPTAPVSLKKVILAPEIKKAMNDHLAQAGIKFEDLPEMGATGEYDPVHNMLVVKIKDEQGRTMWRMVLMPDQWSYPAAEEN